MNKGLLKIALLSMVCASMPAAITSCKDYDDDIDNLDNTTGDLQKQLAALQTEIANLKGIAEQAAANAQAALTAGNDAKAAAELATQAAAQAKADALQAISDALKNHPTKDEFNALQQRLNAIDEKLANMGGTGGVSETTFNEAIQGLQTQLDALNNYKSLLESLGGQQEVLNTIQQTITTINANITALQNGSNDFDQRLSAMADLVAKIQGSLVTINGDELRSLVFNPVFYYHGIEAMWAPTWGYEQLGVNTNVGADVITPNDAPVVGDSVFMTPDLVATYHMNPSKAVMPAEASAYSFTNTIKTVDFVRASNTPVPTIYSATVNNGDVTVKANLKDGILPYIATNEKVTVLALEVNLGDTVITSDYAALKPVYSYGFKLANATEPVAPHQTHWPTTMAEAIAKETPDFTVAWNSPGVNIAEWVDTHYATDESRAAGNDIRWDVNATKNTVREQGFTYEYSLIGYKLGQNQTSESAHGALKVEGNNCIFRPQMTKEGLQQAFGSEQGMASIDRLPIVRVALKDTVSGKYAAVGYIKIQIVPDTKEDTYTVIDPFVDEQAYATTCPLQTYNKPLTWWQVEEQIIEKLGISKQEFEEQYKPDYVDPQEVLKFDGASYTNNAYNQTYVLKQFNMAGEGATELPRNQWVGRIGKTEYDEASSETNILRWVITGEDAYNLFAVARQTTTSVTVRFVKTYTVSMGSNHTQTVHHYVYVTLTWTPKPLNVTPSGVIENNLKIPEMWYKAWTGEHGGFDETHLNVAVPNNESTNPAECTYVSHLLYPWIEEMRLVVTGVDPVYVGYDDAHLTKYFNFDNSVEPSEVYGISGAKYKLTAAGKNLNATLLSSGVTKTIAVISDNNTTSYTTWNSDDPTVTYQENEFAKDLLNVFDHKMLQKGQTLTGKIIITAFNQCDKPIELTGNTYNVRFLRPVNMDVAEGAKMVDAHNSGSTIDLADFLSFTDWRSNDPMSFFSTHANYYPYYGLQSIVVGYINQDDPSKLIGHKQTSAPAVTSGSLRGVITTTLAGGTLATQDANLLALAGNDKSKVGTLDPSTGTPLSKVTPNMDLVYTPATGALGNLNLGKLTYYNNGENVNKAFELRVPLVLTYKWGYLTGYLDITVNPTLGQE